MWGISNAVAQTTSTTVASTATTANASAGGMGSLISYAPFIFLFVLLYFVSIRPQMKKQKEQQKMLSDLKKGDEVLTIGGILGTVQQVDDLYVSVQIAPNMEIKCQKYAIQSVLPKGTVKSI